ncbi:MAG: phosphoribosylformylglycinamidine synthase II, partial [Phenylobacterium sp.]|uniref:AIR synthase-related protein n=1 Tax=Phenylobacterium sp. TaxID=1871053 RepID=UPI001A1EDBF1
NVSLYNETNGAAIPPTPTVGGVGLIADYARRADFGSMKPGDVLVLVGATKSELGASMYLREIAGREDGAPPPVDLALERKTGDVVRGLIQAGQLHTVHDLSDGGLAAALCEMCLASNIGCDLRLEGVPWVTLFAEDQARYLVALNDPTPVLTACRAAGVPAAILGEAGGEAIRIEAALDLPLAELRKAHEGWMPAFMGD